MLKLPELGDTVPRWGNLFSRSLGKAVLSLAGWRFIGELPNLPKFLMVVAPHTSNWDFIYGISTVLALGLRAHWLGKHTLFNKPFGKFMTWLGGIPVERSASHGVVEETAAIFKNRKSFVLAVAPEGTRKKVTKWKTGFYHIAFASKVPIIIAFMDYSRKELGFGQIIYPSGNIDADMEKMLSFYSRIGGKHPQKF